MSGNGLEDLGRDWFELTCMESNSGTVSLRGSEVESDLRLQKVFLYI